MFVGRYQPFHPGHQRLIEEGLRRVGQVCSFVVNGAAQAHDSALTTASAEVKWTNGWSAAATFEGEFSQVTRSYAGKGVVRYMW